MIYLLVGYMWLFIHRPFEVWPWLGDLRIERAYMLLTLFCWTLSTKTWTSNRVNWAVVLLACSIISSSIFGLHGDITSNHTQNWLKLLVFYVIVLTSVRSVGDFKLLIVGFVAVLSLYELHSLREYLNGRGVYRMGIWRMIGVDESMSDANSFAASINYGLPMLVPVYSLAVTKWEKRAVWAAVILGCVCILLTGSRSGFVGLLFAAGVYGATTRYRWKLAALAVLAVPAIWVNLSEELKNRYMTIIDPTRGPANAEVSADSRRVFFQQAVGIWREHPVLGVGPGGFSIASCTGMSSHSLYAETLSELGAFGVVALSGLIIAYWLNWRDGQRWISLARDDPEARFCYLTVVAAGFAVAQLMLLGLAGHNILRYTWLWYAAFSAFGWRFLRDSVAIVECDAATGFATTRSSVPDLAKSLRSTH